MIVYQVGIQWTGLKSRAPEPVQVSMLRGFLITSAKAGRTGQTRAANLD